MIKRISDELLSSIKQPKNSNKRITLHDSLINGFYAVVSVQSISFYLSHQVDGKRKSVKLGRYPNMTTDTARTLALQTICQPKHQMTLSIEPQPAAASSETVKDALIRYANSRTLSPLTVRDLTVRTPQLLGEKLSSVSTSELSADLFESRYRELIKESKESSAKLMARYIGVLFNFLELPSPIQGLKRKTGLAPTAVSVKDRRIEPHQLPDFKRIMPMLTSDQQLSILVALVCGFRKSELQSVTLSSLCYQTQSIRLAKTKNGKSHTIPLPEKLWRQLVEGSNGKPSDAPLLHIGSQLPKAFTRVIELSWHDLRRTCASTLMTLGQSEAMIKSVLNHSTSGNVTQAHYLRFDREEIRQALSMLYDYFDY